MSYQVLALRWRPRTFEEVVGQQTVTRTLQNALSSGRIGHAFLLSGARGVGKTTTARILAKALNCSRGEQPTPRPCDECPACEEITAGTALDVQEIDGATHNGVEQVRELRESARYNPARDRFKIWIIDEVHMLSTGAFNALLKTLEEPPPRVKFIFATTEYHKLPDTILSRCQQYEFRMIPARELTAHLRRVADGEGVQVSDEALARVARAAEGSVRDALSLFDQVLSFSGTEVRDADLSALLGLIDRELLVAVPRAVLEGDSLAALDLVERLSEYGADYRNFARELLLLFREILLVKLAPEGSALLDPILPEERGRLRPFADAFSEEDLLRFVDVLGQLEGELRFAQDPRVCLELALLRVLQTTRLQPFAELVARVEALAPERPGAARAASPGPPRVPRAAPSVAPAPLPAAETRPAAPARPPQAEAATEVPVDGPDGAGSGSDLLAAMLERCAGRPSLAQALKGCRAELDGNTLTLEVASDFRPLAEMHLEEYQALVREVAGRSVKLQLSASAPSPAQAPAGPSAEERRRERLMKQASREPAVQEALDLFGGQIVDVKEVDS